MAVQIFRKIIADRSGVITSISITFIKFTSHIIYFLQIQGVILIRIFVTNEVALDVHGWDSNSSGTLRT